jgi:hypothetical protein
MTRVRKWNADLVYQIKKKSSFIRNIIFHFWSFSFKIRCPKFSPSFLFYFLLFGKKYLMTNKDMYGFDVFCCTMKIVTEIKQYPSFLCMQVSAIFLWFFSLWKLQDSQNRSKMDLLKGGIDDFNYFSLIFSYYFLARIITEILLDHFCKHSLIY